MEYPLATYPGIDQIIDCFGTCTAGVEPDTAIVRFIPQQASPSANGNLRWQQGAQVVQWTDAHLDFTSINGDRETGYINEARIVDRRVWWKYSEINGRYNLREPDGTLIAGLEKTPQELAALLFEAMGETSYSVSDLPNYSDDRPAVNWSGANAAYELEKLCKARGCNVVLRHSTNTPAIVVTGVGLALPSTNAQSVSFGVDIGEVPEFVKIYTAPVLFQCKLKLEAYGYDTDGQLKPIDDLSYTPTNGWEDTNPEEIRNAFSDEDEAAIVAKHVFRLYKITNTSTDDLVVPGYDDPDVEADPGDGDTIDAIEQIYPVNKVLAETYEDAGGVFRRKPAYVEGVFKYNVDEDEEIIGNSSANTRYPGAFQIIPEQGLVLFSQPVWKESATAGEVEPAELYLCTSFNVHSATNGQSYRYFNTQNLGGTGTFVKTRNDLVRVIKASYTSGTPTVVDSVSDNKTTVDTAINNVITAYLPQFASYAANQVKYMGIVAGDVDGFNRQVGYRISRKSGANTTVAQNSEPEMGVMREAEKFQAALEFAQQQAPEDVQRLVEIANQVRP